MNDHAGARARPAAGAAQPFELPIEVRPEDIDQLGHVNNVVYLRWVQDAAVAHWHSRATPAELAEVFWVVVRHEIDYKRAARLGDTVLARTWVGAAAERSFERHTEILRGEDRKLLARARTLWCPVDAGTLKPKPIDAGVRARWSAPAQADGRTQ